MNMTDLPADLVEEILSRVPAPSLKRLRSTCKRWNALFKDRRFTEKHFRKAPKQYRVLMSNADRLCSMCVDLNVVPPSIEIRDSLSLKDYRSNSEQVDIAEVFHCDGLLLCITKYHKLVVWNPILGETRWIKHKSRYDRDCKFALGYENNQSCRTYKILMFRICYQPMMQVDGFEIYEFSSNAWRVVIAPTHCIKGRGVTLKGNTYWISVDNNEDDYYLLSFDFTRERFRRLCLPRPPSLNHVDYKALSVVREEELTVLFYNYIGSSVEMWMTKKIDTEAELLWSKIFAVYIDSIPGNLSYLFTSLLIDEEKKVALCCDVNWDCQHVVYSIRENDEYREPCLLLHTHSSCKPFIFNYVPSLVQFQSK